MCMLGVRESYEASMHAWYEVWQCRGMVLKDERGTKTIQENCLLARYDSTVYFVDGDGSEH